MQSRDFCAAETLLHLSSTAEPQAPPATPAVPPKIDVSDAGLAAFEESVVRLFEAHVHNPAVRSLDDDQAAEITLPVPPHPTLSIISMRARACRSKSQPVTPARS
jgi:hypothetical protein